MRVVVRDGAMASIFCPRKWTPRPATPTDRYGTPCVPCSIKRNRAQPISGQDVFDSRIVLLRSKGRSWRLDARDLLTRIKKKGGFANTSIYCRHWFDGPLADEWVVGAPLVDGNGRLHSRLMVFFAVWVDTTVENGWVYESKPREITYNARLSVAGEPPIKFSDLTHYRQARWHHVAQWRESHSAPWFAVLNSYYVQDRPAAPSYQRIKLSNKILAKARQSCAPMDHCDVSRYMPNTGTQPQTGPLPQWSSAYLINAHDYDYRAYRRMLANSDALGVYGVHYRSHKTNNALSVIRHPYATLVRPVEISRCRVTRHADDRLPRCQHNCHMLLVAGAAHHGAPAYVAYMATGDWFYEQELTFWADYLIFHQNEKYRGYRAAPIVAQQVRGQGWSLGILGLAAYLLPDQPPFKKYFNRAVANNIQWYNAHYANKPNANKLGFAEGHSGVNYPSAGRRRRAGVSPWQLSFFNWAAGNLVDLGFHGAARMRDYFSRFSAGLAQFTGVLLRAGKHVLSQGAPYAKKSVSYHLFTGLRRDVLAVGQCWLCAGESGPRAASDTEIQAFRLSCRHDGRISEIGYGIRGEFSDWACIGRRLEPRRRCKSLSLVHEPAGLVGLSSYPAVCDRPHEAGWCPWCPESNR